MITNSFKDDLMFISMLIRRNECFSFAKFADGEFAILIGKSITNIDGWTFDADTHQKERGLLLEAFSYCSPDYYIGICCPCCTPIAVDWMRSNHRSSGRVTWANVFVNSNYRLFLEYILPSINAWPGKVHLIATENGIGKPLPLKVNTYIPVDREAWKSPSLDKVLRHSTQLAESENGQLFLFCAGPLGNILAYKLHKINPANTYLDIGSTLNTWLIGNNRGYLQGTEDLKKTCVW
jgi:hypothetical protein